MTPKQYPQIGETLYHTELENGLHIYVDVKPEFSKSYAFFATHYGGMDMRYYFDGGWQETPAGVAHFLEHKMFEKPEGDAFAAYAKTGASANAFTSFDKTSYLFSCTDHFEESLEILLDLARRPYFTPASVAKEQGIIGQEIRMYDDDPDWRVFFNLLGALYQKHPVHIDIAGTVESISQIDAPLLYRCHRTFYNLNNMVLCVAGNFTIEQVLQAVDKVVKPDEKPVEITSRTVEEPEEVAQKLVEQRLSVATPLFQFGFKGRSEGPADNFRHQIWDEMLCELIAGEASPLYRRMYDAGIINATFGSEVMVGRDYLCTIFSGESRQPEQVAQEIQREIERLTREGIDREMFELVRRATYGRYIGIFGRTDAVAGIMSSAYLAGVEDPYSILDIVADTTLEELQERLKNSFDTERCALSIVRPVEG